jgi:hypothetical protein
MTEIDIKKLKEIDWTRQHTLTQEQTKQLILDKFRRAIEVQSSSVKREMLVQKHR